MPDYKLIASQIASLAEIDRDFVPVLSNAAALLYEGLERINWAGFYLLDRGSLLVGPFQGRVACVRIAIGKGVCGTAVQEGKPLRVEDVHAFPGHIACDSASRSEIVLPIRSGGQIVGVLDIDSPEKGRFTEEDQQGLAQVVKVLEESTDFSRLRME
ncbi:MAG: GAF domain-containing protein [Acutalibacter sp.]|nr:GAF domain-containing protein [Acutalibacter sp.]